MIAKLMIAVAALAICGASVADAASQKRHAKKHRHAHSVVHRAPVMVEPAYAQYPRRPPWAAPQQCFIEEGYGRFFPCGGGPSIR